jgi:hypothetical protein
MNLNLNDFFCFLWDDCDCYNLEQECLPKILTPAKGGHQAVSKVYIKYSRPKGCTYRRPSSACGGLGHGPTNLALYSHRQGFRRIHIHLTLAGPLHCTTMCAHTCLLVISCRSLVWVALIAKNPVSAQAFPVGNMSEYGCYGLTTL